MIIVIIIIIIIIIIITCLLAVCTPSAFSLVWFVAYYIPRSTRDLSMGHRGPSAAILPVSP
jgi:hypothetical protein